MISRARRKPKLIINSKLENHSPVKLEISVGTICARILKIYGSWRINKFQVFTTIVYLSETLFISVIIYYLYLPGGYDVLIRRGMGSYSFIKARIGYGVYIYIYM